MQQEGVTSASVPIPFPPGNSLGNGRAHLRQLIQLLPAYFIPFRSLIRILCELAIVTRGGIEEIRVHLHEQLDYVTREACIGGDQERV